MRSTSSGSRLSHLQAGPPDVDLPSQPDGAGALDLILGVGGTLSQIASHVGGINPGTIAGAGSPQAELQSELGTAGHGA